MKVLSSDMLRGHIETFILKVLIDGNRYGSEIRKEIGKKTNDLYLPNEQSIYSALHRLEEGGCVKGVWGNEYMGATRKYYTITHEGIKTYEANQQAWKNSKRLVDILIG